MSKPEPTLPCPMYHYRPPWWARRRGFHAENCGCRWVYDGGWQKVMTDWHIERLERELGVGEDA